MNAALVVRTCNDRTVYVVRRLRWVAARGRGGSSVEGEASPVRLHTRHNTQAGRWAAAREGRIVDDEGAGKGAVHISRPRLLPGAPELCPHPP